MLVYGDAERREAPGDKIRRIADALDGAARAAGIVRHGLLVAALIEAGELAQGVADHGFAARGGQDARSAVDEATMAVCIALAREVARSWSGGSAVPGDGGVRAALDRVRGMELPGQITVRQPEGFAHYALYPEAYYEAALELPAHGRPRIIGLRSIGTSLAAMVAAAFDDAGMPVTLRPIGHPFGREIALAPDLAREFAAEPERACIVVDEGPGLSGSSVAAVVQRLEASSTAIERVHLLPSHAGGPGPEASADVVRVWQSASTYVRSFDDVVLGSADPAHRIETWFADLIGPVYGALHDISGGGWRRCRPGEADWPPIHPWQERRKFLAEAESGTWLLKFAGLGRAGLAKSERARALFEAGFTPEPAGWRHGFLAERWYPAVPLDPSRDRNALLARIGAYLGFRARSFPAEKGRGASIEALFAMARVNAAEALGGALAARIDAWEPGLARLERRSRPVETDNRLHVWEWIVIDGRILKTDALDHHAGHDLVGAQDIAWDIAGASVEFDLAADEMDALIGHVEFAGSAPVVPELVAFLRLCYLAFQLGYYTMAVASTGDPADTIRLEAAARRYRNGLAHSL